MLPPAAGDMKRISLDTTVHVFSGSIRPRILPFHTHAPRLALTSLWFHQHAHFSRSRQGISALKDYYLGQRRNHFLSTPVLVTSLDARLRPFRAAGRTLVASHFELRQSSLEPFGLVFAFMVGLSVAAEIFEFSKEDLQYPPLDHSKDSLRLLTLHPGGWLESIKCELSATTFSEKPEYDALSYAWGDSKRTKAIQVNGTKVHIKENLWQALYHLRHPKEQRTLWVDSLC